jgi:hypothetical protein
MPRMACNKTQPVLLLRKHVVMMHVVKWSQCIDLKAELGLAGPEGVP